MYSMTGFGAASLGDDCFNVHAEVKTVNNRFFKLSLRISDGFSALEQRIESLVREKITRGTVNLTVKVRRNHQGTEYRICPNVIQAYYEQLLQIGSTLSHLGEIPPPALDQLALLPGAIENDPENNTDISEQLWPILEKTILAAINQLQTMRQNEGEAMASDLKNNVQLLENLVGKIEQRAPEVAPLYQQKLTERIEKLLAKQNTSLNPEDLAREVALFADRCDISEETVRFRSHLLQFTNAMKGNESCGKKLDFLTQELFRETNTMGSKANDANITGLVVEMKTIIERIREMVQNVE